MNSPVAERRAVAADKVGGIAQAVAPCLNADTSGPTPTIPNPLGEGTLRIAVTRFGHTGDFGVMVAGSLRTDFPTEGERLLLGIGANQTAITIRQKRVEQSLAEQRERLRVTLTSIGDAVITTDTEGRVTSMNPVAESLTGWTHEDATGKPLAAVFKIINEQTRQPVESPVDKVLAEGRVVGLANHTALISRDGTERPIDDSAAPIRDKEGRVVGVVLVFHDITERRRADEAVRESEERFRTLFNSMDEGFCVVEMLYDADNRPIDYRFLEVNPVFEKHTGFVDAVGRTIRELVPDHDAHWFEIYGAVAATGEPKRFVNEAKAMGRWYDVYAYRLGGPDSRRVGILFTDITDRKRVEDNLRQMAADLSEADRRKDEFLATLAHELRNPLAPLRNGLQVMKLARDDAEAVEQARSMMERQLGQMVRLIDDLMDLSRISRGKVELRKERVELAKVVQHAVETSRPLIEASGHDLTIQVPPDPIYVDADLTRLAQVFSNLLNNAAKYTEEGGSVTLTVERQGSDAVVSVRDTGVGIPAHMLPKVFEMFTQVDRTLERSQGGLGIGLSLVKGLVEMHGGSVEARSEGHGMGSEFVVRLPVVLSLAGERRGEEGGEQIPATARRRILVVDDNRDAALSLAMMLKIMGNETQTAHDGLEALAVAAAFRPDVILLDIGMPKLNGYDACRRIREQPWGRAVVLVAQTGWGQEDDRRRSQEAGFDFHMVKPVEPAALEKLLESVAQHRPSSGLPALTSPFNHFGPTKNHPGWNGQDHQVCKPHVCRRFMSREAVK